jgi:phage-related protein
MNEQLKVIISAEIAKFKQNVDNAKKTIQDFYKEAKSNADETFKKAGESIGNGLKAGVEIAKKALAGLGLAFGLVTKGTEEYRKNQAQLKTAFETAGGSAATATQTYNDLYRVLGDSGQATEAAQHLAKLTTEEKALSEWTNICQGVYATFGESLPIESLTEAVNHSAKLGEVQGSLADALEWSGISVDEFNEQLFWCNTEAEREKLIRNTLNGLYSESASAYETNNAQLLAQNEAQTKLTEALAAVGAALTPILIMLTELGATVLAALTPYIESFITNYLPTIQALLEGVIAVLGDTFKWMSQNKELMAAIAIAVGVVVTAIGLYNAAAAIKTAMDAAQVTSIGALIAAHIAQAAAAMAALAPYLLIAAAIAAVIAVVVILIKNWDVVAEAGRKAWEWIKNAWQNVANWFNTTVIQPIVRFFTGLWNSITNIANNIWSSVTNIFNKVTSAISKPFEKAAGLVKDIIEKIKGFFKFEWSLPKLKVPRFSVTPSGWQIGDLLKGVIPKLGITWNARGGVFDKPTLFNYGDSLQGLGENGAEAVVPLENNLEWLDKLAGILAKKLQPAPILLQVDGKTFGQVACDSINKLTKQTGRLPIKVF